MEWNKDQLNLAGNVRLVPTPSGRGRHSAGQARVLLLGLHREGEAVERHPLGGEPLALQQLGVAEELGAEAGGELHRVRGLGGQRHQALGEMQLLGGSPRVTFCVASPDVAGHESFVSEGLCALVPPMKKKDIENANGATIEKKRGEARGKHDWIARAVSADHLEVHAPLNRPKNQHRTLPVETTALLCYTQHVRSDQRRAGRGPAGPGCSSWGWPGRGPRGAWAMASWTLRWLAAAL